MIEKTANIGLIKEGEDEFYNVGTVNNNLDRIDEEFGKKVSKVEGKQLSSEDYTTTEKEKLKNIDENANDYTHPTTAGNRHIPSGGSSGQVLKYGGTSGTASWGSDSYYGTCSTTASTAAKTVALAGFSLFTGATVAVLFSNGNTAASPTLNVNSTGAKSIYYRGSALTASTANILSKNGVYLFVYSGSYWRLIGDVGSVALSEAADRLTTPRTIDGVSFDGSADIVHFGVCETAATTEEKAVSIPGFVLKDGAKVFAFFKNENEVGTPSLNVNNTGGKIIYIDENKALSNAGSGGLLSGMCFFIYYSNHWYLLKQWNTKYSITSFTSNDSENPSAWSSMPTFSGQLSHSALFNRISTMFKNVRYLYKLLGKTDISAIGGGTVTGILKQNLTYKDFSSEVTKLNASTPTPVCYVENGMVYILGGFIAKTTAFTGNLFQIPTKYAPRVEVQGIVGYPSSAVDAGKILSVNIGANGIVGYYQKSQLDYVQRFTIQYPLKTS